MIVVCTKCGAHNDNVRGGNFRPVTECCRACGASLAGGESHLHIELSPPPYPPEPSPYPKTTLGEVIAGHVDPACEGCGALPTHGEHYHGRIRWWCDRHVPMSGHYEDCPHPCRELVAKHVDGKPVIVPAPRPVDDTSRASGRAMIAASLPEGERYDFEQHQFVPCFTCSSAPGSPSLCRGCLANRQTIAELNEIAELADQLAKKTIAARKGRRGGT